MQLNIVGYQIDIIKIFFQIDLSWFLCLDTFPIFDNILV